MTEPSTPTRTPPDGALVLRPDGELSWWSSAPAAVATGVLSTPGGAIIGVDVSYPVRITSWVLPAGVPASELATLLDQSPTWEEHAAVLRRSGELSVMTPDPGPLKPEWSRMAYVEGVRRWTNYPVDEAAMLVDHAVALNLAGQRLAAGQAFSRVVDSLLQWAEMRLDGELDPAAINSFALSISAAAQALGDGPGGAEMREMAVQVHSADVVDAVSALVTPLARGRVAANLGGNTQATLDPLTWVNTFPVDLQVVVPRILSWDGPDAREIIATSQEGRSAMSVTVALSRDTAVTDREVGEFMAHAADAATGELVAMAPLRVIPGSHSLGADLPTAGRDVASLAVGVHHISFDDTALRLDTAGRVLTEVDRWMSEAWFLHRRVRALHLSQPTEESSPSRNKDEAKLQREIFRCVDRAHALLDGHLATVSSTGRDGTRAEPGNEDHLRARLQSISLHRDGLTTNVSPEAGAEPVLLADTLAPDSTSWAGAPDTLG